MTALAGPAAERFPAAPHGTTVETPAAGAERFVLVSETHRLPGWRAIADTALAAGLGVVRYDSVHLPDPEVAARVEFLVCPFIRDFGDGALLGGMARLRVVQMLSAGYDNVLGLLDPAVTLCNAAGMHDAATSELAVGLAIAARRDLPWLAARLRAGGWDNTAVAPGLAGARVVVVGHGHIGRAVERRLAGFECEIVSVARHARPAGSEGAGSRPVHAVAELPELLPTADVVVLILPLTAASRGLFDAGMLARMKDGATLVNVARGPIVDTGALLAELRSGRLTAALDVTDPEPLPADHPLRHQEGVLLSPHVGGNTGFADRLKASFVADQLRRYLAGAALRNVVRPGA